MSSVELTARIATRFDALRRSMRRIDRRHLPQLSRLLYTYQRVSERSCCHESIFRRLPCGHRSCGDRSGRSQQRAKDGRPGVHVALCTAGDIAPPWYWGSRINLAIAWVLSATPPAIRNFLVPLSLRKEFVKKRGCKVDLRDPSRARSALATCRFRLK